MLEQILSQLNTTSTKLVAVSKTKPADRIMNLYERGQRIFGENRVQELVEKQSALPKDIEWHFIGHLQSKKVKHIAPFVHFIHSIDSLKLLATINKQAQKNDRVISVLLQFHIAEEETKYGLDLAEAKALLDSQEFAEMKNVSVCGVMGMATFTDDLVQVRKEFQQLKKIFQQLKSSHFNSDPIFKEISMGMSGDYEIAVEEGSTMVRIGTLLFGNR